MLMRMPDRRLFELEYSPEPKRIVEWVEEAYRETAKLMDLVQLRG